MLPPRAYTFIGLNVIRILSIIAILLVFASNVVTLANDIKAVNHWMEAGKNNNATTGASSTTNSTIDAMRDADYIMGSTVPNQPAGVFWAVLNRLFIIFQTVVLLLSELGWPAKFFHRYFPVLGREFGLGALGLIQMLIGAAVLSHRVDTFTLVSAFLLFSVGCVNVFVGLIFREGAKSKRSITSWREHAKSALPTHIGPVNVASVVSNPPSFVSNLYTGGSAATDTTKGSYGGDEKDKFAGFGFGRQGEKAAAMKGFLISKPVESLPRYAPSPKAGSV